jgi:hypothetical protein
MKFDEDKINLVAGVAIIVLALAVLAVELWIKLHFIFKFW